MARNAHRLSFEGPIAEIEARIEQLEALPEKNAETSEEVRRLKRELRLRLRYPTPSEGLLAVER